MQTDDYQVTPAAAAAGLQSGRVSHSRVCERAACLPLTPSVVTILFCSTVYSLTDRRPSQPSDLAGTSRTADKSVRAGERCRQSARQLSMSNDRCLPSPGRRASSHGWLQLRVKPVCPCPRRFGSTQSGTLVILSGSLAWPCH